MPSTHRAAVVEDPFEALRRLGRAARARTKARLVAVTGSVGKTGTKEALRQVLGAQDKTHASSASYNNHWGVPLTLARMPRDAAFAVSEIGMNHAGEIRPLRGHGASARRAHHHGRAGASRILPFGRRDRRRQGRDLLRLEPGGAAIINVDNRAYRRGSQAHALASPAGASSAFGEPRKQADMRLVSLEEDERGSDAVIDIFGERLSCRIGMPGRHIAMNMLGVLAGVQALGADVEAAGAALAALAPPEGAAHASRCIRRRRSAS